MGIGGRAEASDFKDLFQPSHPFHSREEIFNSGWSPQPFPPSMHERHEHAPQRTPQGVFLHLKKKLAKEKPLLIR
ncbi:hypothetical protein J2Z66_004023 [Paenibacillus eucommiae]|uniref:Uncharacterized protein n=1 Tax=Paenibacillus eucommiae TaxID=1355755 RepID=A0ABS4IXY6_9BACL|nr:hypothetical protein [Paenibacillus eucommiae]